MKDKIKQLVKQVERKLREQRYTRAEIKVIKNQSILSGLEKEYTKVIEERYTTNRFGTVVLKSELIAEDYPNN